MSNNKYLIIVVCLLIGTGQNVLNSQTLTNKRNAYRAADKIVKQQVKFIDPGASGQDLTWDFSMVQPINENYKLDYFIPDSTHMDTLCGLEHRTRYYYMQRNDSLWAIGFENSTTKMDYQKPELKLKFPFSYGDTLYSTFEGKGQYCHRLPMKVKGYVMVIADAEGELILPDLETVKNALRVRTIRHYTETGKDSLEMTLDTYSWYATGIRYPVFESIKTMLSKKGDRKDEYGESLNDTTIFSTSFYYPPDLQISQVQTDSIPTETEDEVPPIDKVFTEAHYLPNPVETNLHVDYKLTRQANVWFSIHNSIGVPQYITDPELMDEGYHNITINMASLITGTYTLYVHVDDMMLRTVIVKK